MRLWRKNWTKYPVDKDRKMSQCANNIGEWKNTTCGAMGMDKRRFFKRRIFADRGIKWKKDVYTKEQL